jgi:RNA polymerase primary sigma factor
LSFELFRANKGLLYKFARMYSGIDQAVDTEDLIQAGYMGLMEAERTYDESKSKWSTWAAYYIRKAMREAVGINTTRIRAHHHAISLDAPVGDEEGDITLMDMLEDESLPEASSGLIRAERAAAVREAVSRLEDRRRGAVELHDLEGQSFAQIGRRWGVTRENVRQLRDRALRDLRRDWKLRRELDEETPYYRHVGLNRFNTTWISSTEAAAMWRIEHAARR